MCAGCCRAIAEAAHAEQDLKAQEGSAFAAKVMLGVSVTGTIFGFIGLYFVYQTLAASRLNNEIARETAERQLRAYMSLEKIGYRGATGQEGRGFTCQ